MDDSLWNELRDFTREEIGRPLFGKDPELTPSTRVNYDLGIDGDDAIEFIEKLFDRFNVANVETFPVNRYFSGEGIDSLALLRAIPALFRLMRTGTRLQTKRSLSLGMLLDAMRAHRWDTEAIERRHAMESRD
ncbi:DUF1493 family protein [Paraburkholderia sp. MMS20-SJTR3]|uniref:DUF1493 family protein n=1 Tax=Paraburkholderia sejongensis TaxID=2886946 RepID=A0ABS8JXU5_9BURK|nr:DUF1493 family protein [Paraburkholderia sp. MMS20-SJTR3]MCC8394729.1 DUF1493 family protein [Paraburkholderia sp. MMS20-SJTR3]